MRTKSNPLVIGLVYAAYAFIATTAIVMHAGCSKPAVNRPEPAAVGRTVPDAAAATVAVVSECGAGSGVILDSERVLTALHVVNCAAWPLVKLPAKVTVVRISGEAYEATVAKVDATKDLARLAPKTPIKGISRASIVHVKPGDKFCAAVAFPEPAFRCGPYMGVNKPRLNGDISIAGDFWFGNSGGGLYNLKGELVGIVTRLQWCSRADEQAWQEDKIRPKRTCGGVASSIDDSTVMQ